MSHKTYKSKAAGKIAGRPQKPQPKRDSKRVGHGSHAHPQPRSPKG
jgi:hypothetical protein